MKKLLLSLFVLLAALPAQAADKGSVYDRVMKTGTIRCGYAAWAPYLVVDVNTGAKTGLMVDYVEQMAKNLSLKVEWTEEVGWGDYIAALESGRIDVYCAGAAPNAERARQSDFTSPIFFMRSEIFARADDTRFDNNPTALNDPNITLSTVEGDIYGKIMDADFPNAKRLDLPQLASLGDLFLTIADGKADATLTERVLGLQFMEKNPGRLKLVPLSGPYGFVPVSLSVKGGEDRFLRMLEHATVEMINNGSMDRFLDKIDPERTMFLRPRKPYEETP